MLGGFSTSGEMHKTSAMSSRSTAEREEEEVAVVTDIHAPLTMSDAPAWLAGKNLQGALNVSLASVATLNEKKCWRYFSLIVGACAAFAALFLYTMWQRTIAAARDPQTGKIREHTFPFFVLCFLGGGFAGLAHLVVTPIDVVKCRMQVGECRSMTEGFRQILNDAKGSFARAIPLLFRGWQPTLVAYVVQGAIKFSLYEIFKYLSSFAWLTDAATAASQGDASVFSGEKLFSYLVSSAAAEVFADIGLAPFETIKIKVQTTAMYPTELATIIPRIWASEGMQGFYKGLLPLWARQVPYTMVKFASFEGIVRGLSQLLLSENPNPAAQLAVTMLAGVLSGVLCGIISHPADTLVSKITQRVGVSSSAATPTPQRGVSRVGSPKTSVPMDAAGFTKAAADGMGIEVQDVHEMQTAVKKAMNGSGSMSAVVELIKELGWKGLWRGLLPRLAMVGSITSMQWLMYDAFKVATGLPTTGSGGSSGATMAPVKV